MITTKISLLVVLLLLLSCGVAAADIEVNTTGWWRVGHAFNASGTPIQAAHDGATAETIDIRAGTYTEGTVTITKSNLTFSGAGKATTIINPPQYYRSFDFDTTAADINYVTIEDLTCGDDEQEGIQLNNGMGYNVSHAIIRNNNLSDLGTNYYCINITLTNNIIGTYTWGVLQSTEWGIIDSTFTDNTWYCAAFVGGCTNHTFASETFSRNSGGYMAVYLTGSGDNDDFTFTNTNIINCGASNYVAVDISDTNIVFTDTTFDFPHNSIKATSGATPHFIQTSNRIFIGDAGYTIVNTTASNLTAADGTYDYRPFWITPSTGELNITSTPTWQTSGNHKKQFNITGTSGTFDYTIGDMLPNAEATISTDSWSDTKTANAAGEITGTYNGGWSAKNFTVKSITPPPTNLQNTTGIFWVNHTWQPGTGTDGYNVSVNSVWHNTTNAYYKGFYLSEEWQNITVWAWNSSMGMSETNISQSTQAPAEIYPITLLSGWNIFGWTDSTEHNARYAGTSIGSNCSYVTERNSTTGTYTTHFMAGPEDENNFAVERGWGYYARVSSETLWTRS